MDRDSSSQNRPALVVVPASADFECGPRGETEP
jgi:hypothetical protein